MQKLINVLALVSFAVSAGVVAGGAYVYTCIVLKENNKITIARNVCVVDT